MIRADCLVNAAKNETKKRWRVIDLVPPSWIDSGLQTHSKMGNFDDETVIDFCKSSHLEPIAIGSTPNVLLPVKGRCIHPSLQTNLSIRESISRDNLAFKKAKTAAQVWITPREIMWRHSFDVYCVIKLFICMWMWFLISCLNLFDCLKILCSNFPVDRVWHLWDLGM